MKKMRRGGGEGLVCPGGELRGKWRIETSVGQSSLQLSLLPVEAGLRMNWRTTRRTNTGFTVLTRV